MSRNSPRLDLACLAALLLGAGGFAAALAASTAGNGGLVIPAAEPGSAGEAAAIFATNAAIALAVLCFAYLRLLYPPTSTDRLARVGHALTGYALLAMALANALAIGAQLGELGISALRRVAPHAAFELGGFALAALAYLRARTGVLSQHGLLALAAASLGALAIGAAVESFVSGAIA